MRKAAQKKAPIRVAKHGDWQRVYAEVDGKDASRVYIGRRRVRVGPAGEVRMAGIGGVGTERAMRGKGLARRVYEQTMREVRRDRYSCAGLLTGSNIVAHRLYRDFGYVDIKVIPQPGKLLDPVGFITKTVVGWATRKPLADWRGTVTVRLREHPPVHVRLDSGQVKALSRAPATADLSITLADTAFASLAWGGVTPEYLLSANELEWQGSDEAWQRLLRALAADRPCIYGY